MMFSVFNFKTFQMPFTTFFRSVGVGEKITFESSIGFVTMATRYSAAKRGLVVAFSTAAKTARWLTVEVDAHSAAGVKTWAQSVKLKKRS